MKEEDKIYGLIAHAEDIQKHAIQLQTAVQEAIKTLPDVSREAIRESANEFIIKGAENASKGILEASSDIRESARFLSCKGLLQGLFLAIVAIVAVGCSIFAGKYLLESRMSKLAELKEAIQQEEKTLTELQSKTWGLELVKVSNGERMIILPKGIKFSHSGDLTDKSGRVGIVIKP